jgi:hypothetical protein
MLWELRVSEMRYRAVLEVLDGAVISAVTRVHRSGCLRPGPPRLSRVRTYGYWLVSVAAFIGLVQPTRNPRSAMDTRARQNRPNRHVGFDREF